jgi:hypothetical protein
MRRENGMIIADDGEARKESDQREKRKVWVG